MKLTKNALRTLLALGFVGATFGAAQAMDVVTVGNPANLKSATVATSETTSTQQSIEYKALTVLNKTYGNPETFAKYGIMYWNGAVLHIGIKDKDQLKEVTANFEAAIKENPMLGKEVVCESTKYTQNEYFKLQNEAINYFTALEGPNKVVTATPDVINHRLNLVVTSVDLKTVMAFQHKFGDTVNLMLAK